jgi:hypothetical protein
VKRFVFFCVTIALLLLSQALCLFATRAAASNGPIKVDNIGFYYKLDEKARYMALKTQWQSEHHGEISTSKASELAMQAYTTSSVESTFDQWRYQGGPDPAVFTGKAHLYNTGQKALLNVPVSVTVRAKVGDLRVNPSIQMTDYDTLKDTSEWELVSQKTVTIPAIAPGEDMLLPLMEFHLLDFLSKHPNRWPLQLEVTMASASMGSSRQTISLIPDHFVVPVSY